MSIYDRIEAEAAFAEEMKSRAVRAEVERDDALAEALFALGDLQNATGALLASMHDVHVCHACRAIATRRLWNEPGMSWFGCDEHGATHSEDLPHATALRGLSALLEGKP